jgi:endonuclease/exonuclease/phosphatase family metal-dependent hydrolase
VVRFPSKRVGSDHLSPAMYDFSDFISTNGLIDVPLSGGLYTWSNNREVSSISRIDRYLFTVDSAEGFINISKKRLTRMNSDHFPISLERGNI